MSCHTDQEIGINRDPQYPNPYKSCFSIFSCFMLNTHNTIIYKYAKYIQYDIYNMLHTHNTIIYEYAKYMQYDVNRHNMISIIY